MDREVLLQWRGELVERSERLDRLLFRVRALLADFGETPVADGGARKYRNSKYFRAADAAVEVLRGRGTTMHRSELFRVMGALGFQFGGAVPLNSLTALLCYDSRFAQGDVRGFWELAEWRRSADPVSGSLSVGLS